MIELKKDDKDKIEKNLIYVEWEQQWRDYESFDEKKDVFYTVFKEIYKYINAGSTRNREANFFWKQVFLWVLMLGSLFTIFVSVLSSFGQLTGKTGLFYSIASACSLTIFRLQDGFWEYIGAFLIWFIFAGIIAKWLKVKKYQETWVRHSNHKHKLEIEMLKFIYKLDTYSAGDIREKFMIEIMKIWDENQKVFSDNMNNKEIPMHDMIDYIKELKNK